MKKKIILFAFASNDLKRSAERLSRQANDSKFYDKIDIITSDKIDNILKEWYQDTIGNIENPETGEASADKNTGTGSVDKGKTNVKKEEEKRVGKHHGFTRTWHKVKRVDEH